MITRTVTMAGVCSLKLSVRPVLLILAVDIFGRSGVMATMIVLTGRMRLAAMPAAPSPLQLQPVSINTYHPHMVFLEWPKQQRHH